MLVKIREVARRIKRRIAGDARATKRDRSAEEVFGDIYHSNFWANSDSRSGAGSDLVQTEVIRRKLPTLIKELGVKTMLDIPCGDWHWMKEADLKTDYIGADIVPEMVSRNKELYSNDRCQFMVLNLIKDDLPKVDMIFSRDVLVHLSFEDIFSALHNIQSSGSSYLLTTTFTGRDSNIDIKTGDWRTLNLQLTPFNFPEPVKIINEGCTQFNGDYSDKSLGLWKIQDLKL
jgi:SAM-dependent methyltransferase